MKALITISQRNGKLGASMGFHHIFPFKLGDVLH